MPTPGKNFFSDDYIIFLTEDVHVCYTVFAENTYLSSNKIPEGTYSILSYLHIGGAK